MKLSELKLDQKVILSSREIDYKFGGIVKICPDGGLWLTDDDKGYIINEKFDHLWEVKIS